VKLNLLAIAVVVSGSTTPLSAHAQVLEARVGRWYDSSSWTSYRVGFTRPVGGILAVQIHGDYLQRVGGAGGFAGVGTDFTAFRTGGEGPYLVAGVSGGLGNDSSTSFSTLWGSWSAGAGYDVFPVSFLSLGLEGRYREMTVAGRSGFELVAGFGIHAGRKSSAPGGAPPPPSAGGPVLVPAGEATSELDTPGPSAEKPRSLADSIVATATAAMGRPYEYGGTGEDGEGFDCSGLIQHAYGKHGIELPRRSVDQAREGRKVDRNTRVLAPADILTFSNHGSEVTHVGLYIGSGRFIHSATRGVQVSTLSPDDPYGRWWYKRWVGVRRVVR
jgi:cell wall-associated NlpC family hydrolase